MFLLLVIYNALTPTFIIVAFIEYYGWTNYIWMLAYNEENCNGAHWNSTINFQEDCSGVH